MADPFRLQGELASALLGLERLELVRRGILVHATTPRPPVGQTPHQVVHTQDKLVLRHYPPMGQVAPGPALVVVPSLINKWWILDLEPDRSLVAALSASGHPVYLVDWGTPGPEDAHEDVGYVLLELLHRAVSRAARHARRYGRGQAAVLGYCMGGTLAAMYAALRPDSVAGLLALNAPVRFSEGGRFRDLVDPEVFDVDRAVDRGGLVPVEVMAPAFRLLDPMGNWTKYLAIEAASRDPRQLVRTLARERWLEESVPVSGAFAAELIEQGYQQDRLLDGTWEVRGQAVRLEHVTAPTLVVACERDFIAPPASALPLAEAVSGPSRAQVLDTGHIGVVVGKAGPRTFYPLVDRWLRELP